MPESNIKIFITNTEKNIKLYAQIYSFNRCVILC